VAGQEARRPRQAQEGHGQGVGERIQSGLRKRFCLFYYKNTLK